VIRLQRSFPRTTLAVMALMAITALFLLSGCASLRGPASVQDAQEAVIAAGGNADDDKLLDYANALFHAGNVAQAFKVLDAMPDASRQSPRWLVLHGATRGELQDKIGARADFEAAAAMGSEAAKSNLVKLADH